MQNTTNYVQIHTIRKVDYQNVWDFQGHLVQKLIQSKRKLAEYPFVHHLIFCEHNPVYTIGKSGSIENLLYSEKTLKEKGIDLYKINRGGDITYHGPGQWTIYPILNLERLFRDLHKYIRLLEECVIKLLKLYKLEGLRIKEYTGVWIKDGLRYKKICAIGVHMSRWVSMHGLALNINTDLDFFKGIVPCGINDKDKEVCSLGSILSEEVNMMDVQQKLQEIFCQTFNLIQVENYE